MKTNEVRYVKELYPRLKPSDEVIERYRAAIGSLPPIVVARDGIIVDGYHRWQAHKREEVEEIAAENLGDLSDTEIFNESIKRNASHGHQLSAKDKRDLAGKIWRNVAHIPSKERIAHIAELLSVSERSVTEWTKDARTAEKDEQKAKAWDMWLDCHSERDIAKALDVGQATIHAWLDRKEQICDFRSPPESRQHFDIWQFNTADKSAGSQSYFGACPPQVIENLLWFYTEPKTGVVVDLFAGSGTTIDVAKSMGRRVWASDIRGNHYADHLPIHEYDASQGWPDAAPGKADLVFLDPPYWKQATGRYSSHDNEFAEMGIDRFYKEWFNLVAACKSHLKPSGRIAYIISPTHDKDAGVIVDHAFEMVPDDMRVERRVIVPYQTQQATGQQVEWARENKQLLKLYRDLVVIS